MLIVLWTVGTFFYFLLATGVAMGIKSLTDTSFIQGNLDIRLIITIRVICFIIWPLSLIILIIAGIIWFFSWIIKEVITDDSDRDQLRAVNAKKGTVRTDQ